MKKKILVFGTGSVANYLFDQLDFEKVEIEAFINSRDDVKEFRGGIKVVQPGEIENFSYDFIIIASGFVAPLEKILLSEGVPQEKIISYVFDDQEENVEIAGLLKDALNQRYNKNNLTQFLHGTDEMLPFYHVTMDKRELVLQNIYKDYVREQTVYNVSREILRKNMTGAVAELGVFRGDFTVLLDRWFPTQQLFLFDTFEGFAEADLKDDKSGDDTISNRFKFKDTSDSFVLHRLEHPERVVIKKGYFPDTFDLTDDMRFSFVSIDMDLYKPIKSALELFWPIMEKGGYIFVHDYNSPYFGGSFDAVNEWCDDHGVPFLPLSDELGSAVIMKE